jgi:hypothetical protein
LNIPEVYLAWPAIKRMSSNEWQKNIFLVVTYSSIFAGNSELGHRSVSTPKDWN